MPDPMDDFERELADRLRGWTEPASQSRDYAADAQVLLAVGSGPPPPRFSHRVAMIATTVVAAVAVAGAVLSLMPSRSPAASTGPSPTVAPSAAAMPSAEPSAMAGRDLDLADITWYTLVSVAFGTSTEPSPNDPPLPDPYDLLTVGTLDGQVTTQLHLSTRVTEDGHDGAWANGPYGLAVLVGDDDGTRSRLFTVSSLDGSETTQLETSDAVVVGALSEDEGAIYFVPVDRVTGVDRGLWRLPVGGSAEEVVAGPIAKAPNDYASRWTMDWSADGSVLVTQACHMRSCTTLVLDRGTRASRLDGSGARLIGVTDADYVTDSSIVALATGESTAIGMEIGGQAAVAGRPGDWYLTTEPDQQVDARAYALISAPIRGGHVRTLVEVDSSEPTDARMKIGQDSGVGLPTEWVLRWPTEASRYMDIPVPPETWYAGELVNVISGERVSVPPTVWPDTPTDCDPVAPVALPSGAVPGPAVTTAGGHFLWATWGAGSDDQIVQTVGGWLFAQPSPTESGDLAADVTVRGQPARVVPMGSSDGPWAIAWEENGCRYEVQTLPGTTRDEAIEYAARYGRDAAARPPLVVPAAIAARTPLPWCGHEIVNRQPEADYRDAAVWECFLTARNASEPAEMVSDIRTVEGGWIREFYRTLANGDIEVYADPSRDNASGPGWTRRVCASLHEFGADPNGTPVLFPDDCAPSELVAVGDLGLEEQRMVEELIGFTQVPNPPRLELLPFADDVALGLAGQVMEHRTSSELLSPDAWILHAETFRGRVGPFSAMETLAEWNVSAAGILIREAQVTVGPHEHCASPPIPPPDDLAGLRRISVQPVGEIACPMWWTVDLFLAGDGRIAGVTLDFYEP